MAVNGSKSRIATLRALVEEEGGLDPELEKYWAMMVNGPSGYGMTIDTIPASREAYLAGVTSLEVLRRGGDVDVSELTVPGADGTPLPAMIFSPANRSGMKLPCIYYTANGGKHVQHPLVGIHTSLESDWVADLGIVFVSVAPRVGPEHRHPAQVEDAYAGLLWLVENAENLGVDADRIIIEGKSGGGGVAAATALYARDRGGPSLTHQILVCPMIDDRGITVSSQYRSTIWDAQSNRAGWESILGDSVGGEGVSPYAAPARANDLSRLPNTYLDAGSSEVFRDEILDYGARLAQAGVPMEVHSWGGAFHGFDSLAPDTEFARMAVAVRTNYLRRALKQQVSPVPNY